MKINVIFSVIFFFLITLIAISNPLKSNELRIVATVLLIITAIIYFIVTGRDKNNRR